MGHLFLWPLPLLLDHKDKNHNTFITLLPAKITKKHVCYSFPHSHTMSNNPMARDITIQNALILYVCVEKEKLI